MTIHPMMLKAGMLASCNKIREAFGAPAFEILPPGGPGCPHCCPGKKTLDDLFPGDFRVMTTQLVANRQFAGVFAALWGTKITACQCDEFAQHDCDYLAHVDLPPSMTSFILAFDRQEIPELITTCCQDEDLDHEAAELVASSSPSAIPVLAGV